MFMLAVSGKKQSGKDTLVNYLHPIFERSGRVAYFSFADSLKQFLEYGMGIPHECLWGTDNQKNQLTDFKWENLPLKIRWDNSGRPKEESLRNYERWFEANSHGDEFAWSKFVNDFIFHLPMQLRKGPMTAREVMQVFGTDLMRNMFDDKIWVNATFREMNREAPDFALLPDMRFPSELDPWIAHGGYIIRLMRDVSDGDPHPSETSFDGWNWESYGDRVLVVHKDATIEEVREQAVEWLKTKTEGVDYGEGYPSPQVSSKEDS